MTAIILRKTPYGGYLDNEFEYCVGNVQKTGLFLQDKDENYYGYHQKSETEDHKVAYIKSNFNFVRIKGKEDDWRRATDPKLIRKHFVILTVSNFFVFVGTELKRIGELFSIVIRVFYETCRETYKKKDAECLSEVYITQLNRSICHRKGELKALWGRVKEDFKCAGLMELAAIHALLNPEDSTKMQRLFADAEATWNGNKSLNETSSYGGSVVSVALLKIFSPITWTMFVHKCKPDDGYVASRLISLDDSLAILTDPIPEVENQMNKTPGARITEAEEKILTGILAEKPFVNMSTEQCINSRALKMKYLGEVVKGLPMKGLIQYQCAYPYTKEKVKRIVPIPETISSTFAETKQKFDEKYKS